MQVYLESEQKLRLNALARSRGRPAAELIREAVERYLDEHSQSIETGDPLLDLIGAAGALETERDVASNHHRYLAVSDSARPVYSLRENARPKRVRKTRVRSLKR